MGHSPEPPLSSAGPESDGLRLGPSAATPRWGLRALRGSRTLSIRTTTRWNLVFLRRFPPGYHIRH
jgi:hypothetical protein